MARVDADGIGCVQCAAQPVVGSTHQDFGGSEQFSRAWGRKPLAVLYRLFWLFQFKRRNVAAAIKWFPSSWPAAANGVGPFLNYLLALWRIPLSHFIHFNSCINRTNGRHDLAALRYLLKQGV